MNTPRKLWRLLALLFAFTLLAAACGDDDDGDGATDGADDGTDDGADDGSDDGSADGTTIEALDLSDQTYTVGSKNFTEQFVLGELLVASLEAAGAEVNNQIDLGGTEINRESLLTGNIDMYWEYNGTGWTVHLTREDPSDDPDTLTQNVREADLEENNIRWIGQSPFNNTYGFATATDFLDDGAPFSFDSMAAYLEANSDAIVCMEEEFPVRPDGLVLWEEATGYEIPESQIEILESGAIYNQTANGDCDFGEIFTTDGRIPALDLNVVEDPGVMILYNVSLTLPDDVYQTAPEAIDTIVGEILAPLDDETMAELNRRVTEGGEDAADVASQFLVDEGIISG
ncbi:MAG: glycine betaine ABC transporter substrate-binding protein [Acidimicrobiales bacterium]